MGNLQNNICMDTNITPYTTPVIKNRKTIKHIKPSFTKASPKFICTEHHIKWADIDDNFDPELAEQEPTHNIKQFDKKSTKFIQQIKIKWNAFIKMKHKNFLSDYDVIQQIGKGGYGTVYKVKAKYTQVTRAAKIIKKTTLGQDELERLLIEMSIMIDLDHPNIARLFEVYDYKLHFVLIVELCEGGQLFRKIAIRNITQDEITQIMVQLLRALQYLHSRGIIHRDLKPENILFEKDTNNIKLIDFGIATRYKSDDQPLTTRVGTPFYIAPEVLCKCYTEKCDIWSIGIILYMMINSKPPFNGQDEIEIMHNILATDANFKYNPFTQVTKQTLNLLKKLLTKNPDNRPSAFQAYNHPYIQNYVIKTTTILNYDNVLNTISQFNFSNRLQAVVLTFIVSQILTSKQKKDMKLIFEHLDKDHDGVLNLSELKLAFRNRKDMDDKKINSLMRRIDTNSSGSIEFTQFIVAALGSEQYTTIHFEEAFAYFDIHHLGYITFQEISSFLQNKQYSETQIRKLFETIDQNNDGLISKQQFLQVLSRKDVKSKEYPKRVEIHPVKPIKHK